MPKGAVRGRGVDITHQHFTHNQHAAQTFTAFFSTSVVVSVCVRFSSSGRAVLHRPHVRRWLKKKGRFTWFVVCVLSCVLVLFFCVVCFVFCVFLCCVCFFVYVLCFCVFVFLWFFVFFVFLCFSCLFCVLCFVFCVSVCLCVCVSVCALCVTCLCVCDVLCVCVVFVCLCCVCVFGFVSCRVLCLVSCVHRFVSRTSSPIPTSGASFVARHDWCPAVCARIATLKRCPCKRGKSPDSPRNERAQANTLLEKH